MVSSAATCAFIAFPYAPPPRRTHGVLGVTTFSSGRRDPLIASAVTRRWHRHLRRAKSTLNRSPTPAPCSRLFPLAIPLLPRQAQQATITATWESAARLAPPAILVVARRSSATRISATQKASRSAPSVAREDTTASSPTTLAQIQTTRTRSQPLLAILPRLLRHPRRRLQQFRPPQLQLPLLARSAKSPMPTTSDPRRIASPTSDPSLVPLRKRLLSLLLRQSQICFRCAA